MTSPGAFAGRLPWAGPGLLLAALAGCATPTGATAPGKSAPATASATGPAAPQKAPAAPAADLFEGCQVSSDGANGRLIECDRFMAVASEEPANASSEDDALNGMLDKLKASIPIPLESQKTEVVVGGMKRKALRVSGNYSKPDESNAAKPGEARRIAGTLTTLLTGSNTRRELLCVDMGPVPSDATCGRVLEALTHELPALTTQGGEESEAAESTPAEPIFAGRKLQVPEGCKALSGHLRCPNADLGWLELPHEDPMALESVTQLLQTRIGQQGGTAQARARKCEIEGVATTCRQIDARKEGAPHLTFLLGMVTVRGKAIFVQCQAVDGPDNSTGAPCDQVMKLK